MTDGRDEELVDRFASASDRRAIVAVVWCNSPGERGADAVANISPRSRAIEKRALSRRLMWLVATMMSRYQENQSHGRAMAVVDAIALARQQARLTLNMLRPTGG